MSDLPEAIARAQRAADEVRGSDLKLFEAQLAELRKNWESAKQAFSFRGLLKAMEIEIDLSLTNAVWITAKVPDPETDEMVTIGMEEKLIPTDVRIEDVVRRGLHKMMMHEVDEGILAAGRVPFDPHTAPPVDEASLKTLCFIGYHTGPKDLAGSTDTGLPLRWCTRCRTLYVPRGAAPGDDDSDKLLFDRGMEPQNP